MTETIEQRQKRLAFFARDAVKAKSDYQKETEAVAARTAKLRAERLQREASIPAPAEKKRKRG
jgi:hypothetical protein